MCIRDSHNVASASRIDNQVFKPHIVVDAFNLLAMQSRDKAHIGNVARSQNEVVTVTGAINRQRVVLGYRCAGVKDRHNRTAIAKNIDFVVVGASLSIEQYTTGKSVRFEPNNIVHSKSVIAVLTKNVGRTGDCFHINRVVATTAPNVRGSGMSAKNVE